MVREQEDPTTWPQAWCGEVGHVPSSVDGKEGVSEKSDLWLG